MTEIAEQQRRKGIIWTQAQRRASEEALRLVERDNAPPTEPVLSAIERAVGRWFLHRATRFRFVGMARSDVLELRRRCIAASALMLPHLWAADPDMPESAVVEKLDSIAEAMYPQALAEAWRRNQEPKLKTPAQMSDSEYPF